MAAMSAAETRFTPRHLPAFMVAPDALEDAANYLLSDRGNDGYSVGVVSKEGDTVLFGCRASDGGEFLLKWQPGSGVDEVSVDVDLKNSTYVHPVVSPAVLHKGGAEAKTRRAADVGILDATFSGHGLFVTLNGDDRRNAYVVDLNQNVVAPQAKGRLHDPAAIKLDHVDADGKAFSGSTPLFSMPTFMVAPPALRAVSDTLLSSVGDEGLRVGVVAADDANVVFGLRHSDGGESFYRYENDELSEITSTAERDALRDTTYGQPVVLPSTLYEAAYEAELVFAKSIGILQYTLRGKGAFVTLNANDELDVFKVDPEYGIEPSPQHEAIFDATSQQREVAQSL